ncbi:hypothetical protein [Roseimaritima sediminicola]|uniref:hypothetical protein n=1 Tax=Roseimaritima sediminicola TaxID=2662066 RepID=UPI0012982600|nr:hypothetical protein [Roseimaritima sediminicola]
MSSGDASQTDASPESGESFIEATVVREEIVSDARVGIVRTGSPFVTDPPIVAIRAGAALQMRREFEAGLWRVTAGSAVLAAGMLVAFGLIALGVFPTGALLIAGLGILMSLLGLTSIYPKWALALLLAHVGIFVSTFWRSLQT